MRKLLLISALLLFASNGWTDIPISEFEECSTINNKIKRINCFDKLGESYIVPEKQSYIVPEKQLPPYVKTIHTSIGKHFQDNIAQKEQFKEEFTAETLELILGLIKKGQWRVGNSGGDFQIDLPENPWSCSGGTSTASMNDKEFKQFTDHMVRFWKDAEKGTNTNSSQFNKTIDFYGRMSQILSANDLLLCSFNASLNNNPGTKFRKIDAAEYSVIEDYLFKKQ